MAVDVQLLSFICDTTSLYPIQQTECDLKTLQIVNGKPYTLFQLFYKICSENKLCGFSLLFKVVK